MEAEREPAESLIQVLTKAVQVMDCFSLATPVMHMSEVRRRTGLPTTTCARILRSLVAEDLLERDGDDYRVGLRVLAWAASATAGSRLVAEAVPIIDALRDETEETAGIYIRNGATRIAVAVAESPQPIMYRGHVGQVMPMHAGAAGKVFMAFDPEAWPIAQSAGFAALTEYTVTDRQQLEHQLEQVRRSGNAVARDERDLGLSSVAAPVRSAGGRPVGVLAIGLPSFRFGPEEEARLTSAVTVAAHELSRRLGHVPAAGVEVYG